MHKIRYTVLAPLVRALLAQVCSRPAAASAIAPHFLDAREIATRPADLDQAPPTTRRAA